MLYPKRVIEFYLRFNFKYLYIDLRQKFQYLFHKGKLPDFLIIGTTKGGTTSLWHHLDKHPQIQMAPNYLGLKIPNGFNRKEIYFFWNKYCWSRGERWYKSLFNDNNKLQGEATANYINFYIAHERMHQVVPHVKLILVLREPVTRAYSHYNMLLQDFFMPYTFEGVIENNFLQIISTGFYVEQIQNLLRYFLKEQILFIISEKMKKNPQLTYNKIFDFLNIKKITINIDPNINKNKYSKPMSEATREKLAKIYKPYNEKLFEFLGYRITEWDEMGSSPRLRIYHKND